MEGLEEDTVKMRATSNEEPATVTRNDTGDDSLKDRPDQVDLLALGPQIAEFQKPVQQIYLDALSEKEATEADDDVRFNDAAKDYIDLHQHVESSTNLLASLETFLATFQNDLSAVSGHISELQQRSRLIDARLEGRKTLQTQLGPVLASMIIPPELIDIIIDTDPSERWLEAIEMLEQKLTAIRSGPRIAARQDLDMAAEKLRIRAVEKVRRFLIDTLTPYRTSVSANLQTTQATTLTRFRSFYAFLQRHAARQAHEVQKYYISTATWYYETGFRRYTRALEKIRVRSVGKDDSSLLAQSGMGSLTAMMQRNLSTATVTQNSANEAHADPVAYSRVEGPPLILGYLSDSKETTASSEALFRSIIVTLADNASSEYAFVTHFFGKPAERPFRVLQSDNYSASSSAAGWDVISRKTGDDSLDDAHDVFDDSASMITTSEMTSPSKVPGSIHDRNGKTERGKRSATDHIWKQIMEPVMEYCRVCSSQLSFINSVLSVPLVPPSILAMIRLNDSLTHSLAQSDGCPHKSMEGFLFSINMLLWPLYQKEMGNLTEIVRKTITTATTTSGLFGGKQTGVKDAVVQKSVKDYIQLFNSIVDLSEGDDEDMAFSSLLRLRSEIQKLIAAQASKLTDKKQASAYQSMLYEELLSGITSRMSSHPRAQAEVAHFKEMLRNT